MKLPDFLEELNQGAEKAFGEHAQKMIDSLLDAKLPPKLKRLVNMARLENGSYDEIVALLERELELNALEESDDLPMATMTSSSTKPKTPLSTGQMSDITCNYCKEKGHMVKDCEKFKKERKMPNKANRLRRKRLTPNAALVARPTTPKRDVGKGQAPTLSPSAPDLRNHPTMILIPRPPGPTSRQHHPALNPHPVKMTQKTSFATTTI